MMEEGEIEFKDLPEDKGEWPTVVAKLSEFWPCISDERHTFAPFVNYCLCGALRRSVTTSTGEVFAVTPNLAMYQPITALGITDYSARTVRCPVCNQPFSSKGLRIHQGMTRHRG